MWPKCSKIQMKYITVLIQAQSLDLGNILNLNIHKNLLQKKKTHLTLL